MEENYEKLDTNGCLKLIGDVVRYSLYDLFFADPDPEKKIGIKNHYDAIAFFKYSNLFKLTGLNLEYIITRYIRDNKINLNKNPYKKDILSLLEYAKKIGD